MYRRVTSQTHVHFLSAFLKRDVLTFLDGQTMARSYGGMTPWDCGTIFHTFLPLFPST